MSRRYTVAMLWAGDSHAPTPALESTRLVAIARALAAVDIEPVGVVYSDDIAPVVHDRLVACDGVLVWVNPIERGGDRTVLNAMLRQVAASGVSVSAHPDVIDAIGTKEVLYHTRDMSWGSDVRRYSTHEHFRRDFPASLASGPRVLKRCRGNGGNGVWKVELLDRDWADPTATVVVRHAARGSVEERTSLGELLHRFAPYFDRGGVVVDQAFQSRIVDGMVRCYLAGDRVVGFGEQKINALLPASSSSAASPEPGPRLYFPPTREDFQPLKGQLESQWLPELCTLRSLTEIDLPAIWDVDFFPGAEAHAHVLCEINVSSVFPIPDSALAPLAERVALQLTRAR
jgi:hypothetical protein